jgi:aryl-alcohol dehydrogenase-like predicted oxidoreductase
MRTVFVPSLQREVSALGFGCAPLGSHVSEAQGLKALQAAYDRGVTWYDTAPPYGDGEAEGILGRFLAGRRDKVVICTKFGIPRPVLSPLMRFVRPVIRAAGRIFVPFRLGADKPGRVAKNDRFRPEQIETSVTAWFKKATCAQLGLPGPRRRLLRARARRRSIASLSWPIAPSRPQFPR